MHQGGTGGDGTDGGAARALAATRAVVLRAAAVGAAVNLLVLTGPVYMLQVYDRVLGSGSVQTLLGLAALAALLYALHGFYVALRGRMLSRAAHALDAALAAPLLERRLSTGRREAMTHLSRLRSGLSGPAVTALLDLPFAPLFLGAVFLLHPLLGLLTAAGAAVAAGIALWGRRAARLSAGRSAGPEAAAARLAEAAAQAADTIRPLGMSARIAARWRGLHDEGLAGAQPGREAAATAAAVSGSFRLLLQSGLLTLGAWLTLQGQLSAGAIVAVSILAGRALAPIDQVVGQWRAVEELRHAWSGLNEAADEIAAAAPRTALPDPIGALSLRDVTVLAPHSPGEAARAPRLLAGVSLDIAPGEVIGIAGPSGSGKTTLTRVLTGTLAPAAGEVRLDGATLDQWDPAALGPWLGVMTQRVDLLPGTVAQNIARFAPDAADADVVDAAYAAGMHEMILALPRGYDTPVGGPDQPLSGGQVQRIGLARALYGDPAVVVLDEPNAHLDAEGEAALAEAVKEASEGGATVVFTSHKPGLLRCADRIVGMRDGRIARIGTPAEMGLAAPAPAPAPAPDVPTPAPAASAPPKVRPPVDLAVIRRRAEEARRMAVS
ncbi:MAG: type I secretion system permease/ATPase [Hasllibacter sp.]